MKLKHNKPHINSDLNEAISWEGVKAVYGRAKVIVGKILNAFKNEGRETTEMMRVFNYQLRKKLNLDTRGDTPTPEEVKNALEQLKDIPRLAPYAVILLSSPIPFSSVMYTAFGMYLKKVSGGYINLLPGSFTNVFDDPNKEITEMKYIRDFNYFVMLKESLNDVIEKVRELAVRLHGEQKRKYTGDPYYTHLFRVSDTVRDFGGDESMIMAALLHDVLEDTPTTEEELIIELENIVSPEMARDIANLVVELTDFYTKENFPDLNRRARKEMEAKRLGEVSSRAQTIKYADLLDNSDDIMRNDPSFGRVYIKEKEQILKYMTNGDPVLYSKCLDTIH